MGRGPRVVAPGAAGLAFAQGDAGDAPVPLVEVPRALWVEAPDDERLAHALLDAVEAGTHAPYVDALPADPETCVGLPSEDVAALPAAVRGAVERLRDQHARLSSGRDGLAWALQCVWSRAFSLEGGGAALIPIVDSLDHTSDDGDPCVVAERRFDGFDFIVDVPQPLPETGPDGEPITLVYRRGATDAHLLIGFSSACNPHAEVVVELRVGDDGEAVTFAVVSSEAHPCLPAHATLRVEATPEDWEAADAREDADVDPTDDELESWAAARSKLESYGVAAPLAACLRALEEEARTLEVELSYIGMHVRRLRATSALLARIAAARLRRLELDDEAAGAS